MILRLERRKMVLSCKRVLVTEGGLEGYEFDVILEAHDGYTVAVNDEMFVPKRCCEVVAPSPTRISSEVNELKAYIAQLETTIMDKDNLLKKSVRYYKQRVMSEKRLSAFIEEIIETIESEQKE